MMARLLPPTPRRLQRLREILRHPGICTGCLSKKVPAVNAFVDGDDEALSIEGFRQLQRDLQQIAAMIDSYQASGKLFHLEQLIKDKRIHHRKVFPALVLKGVANKDNNDEEWLVATAEAIDSFASIIHYE